MSYRGLKTEHSGPKKGSGAYWGRKFLAKKLSRKKRRKISKSESREMLAEVY